MSLIAWCDCQPLHRRDAIGSIQLSIMHYGLWSRPGGPVPGAHSVFVVQKNSVSWDLTSSVSTSIPRGLSLSFLTSQVYMCASTGICPVYMQAYAQCIGQYQPLQLDLTMHCVYYLTVLLLFPTCNWWIEEIQHAGDLWDWSSWIGSIFAIRAIW